MLPLRPLTLKTTPERNNWEFDESLLATPELTPSTGQSGTEPPSSARSLNFPSTFGWKSLNLDRNDVSKDTEDLIRNMDYIDIEELDIPEYPVTPTKSNKNQSQLPRLVDRIGEGVHSNVYSAKLGSRLVAAKVAAQATDERFVERDRDILTFIHENLPENQREHIIAIFGFSYVGDERPALWLDLAECNLWTMVQENTDRNETIGTSLLSLWTYEILEAVHAIQSIQLVHGDIKPQNILVMKNLSLKLSDFESAFTLDGQIPPLTASADDVVGTTAYNAPELLKADDTRPSFESDIFSLGATLFAVATGEEPYQRARSVVQRIIYSQSGNPIRYASSAHRLNGSIGIVVRGCCQKKPSERQTTHALMQRLHY